MFKKNLLSLKLLEVNPRYSNSLNPQKFATRPSPTAWSAKWLGECKWKSLEFYDLGGERAGHEKNTTYNVFSQLKLCLHAKNFMKILTFFKRRYIVEQWNSKQDPCPNKTENTFQCMTAKFSSYSKKLKYLCIFANSERRSEIEWKII